MRQRRVSRRRVPANWRETQGRPVGIDAAIMRRRAQRTAAIRADRQRPEAASERRRRAARGAPRREAQIPRIIGRPVDVVVGLPVAQHQRHIGLAEDDGAGFLQTRDGQSVFLRREAFELGVAPRRGQSGNVEGFFHCDRDAEQCARLSAQQSDVRRPGCVARALEIVDNDRIDAPVHRLDASDHMIHKLQRGNLSRLQCGRKILDGAVIPFRCWRGYGFSEPARRPTTRRSLSQRRSLPLRSKHRVLPGRSYCADPCSPRHQSTGFEPPSTLRPIAICPTEPST